MNTTASVCVWTSKSSRRERQASSSARGFTLIDLLVTTAVGTLILLVFAPAIQNARHVSRDAVCAGNLHDFGVGLQCYAAEQEDWIPGVNTSGVATRVLCIADPAALQSREVPVQSYDWMTPLWSYMRETQLPDGRAERWHTLWTEFKCPSMKWENDYIYGVDSVPDQDDFLMYSPPGCSYLSPAAFALWGSDHNGEILAEGVTPSGRAFFIEARTDLIFSAVQPPAAYVSRLCEAGSLENKLFAADGARYVRSDVLLDLDVRPDPDWFGAFTTLGGWDLLSNAYGVALGSENWDGDFVSQGSESQGRNLPISYRHGSPEPLAPANCLSASPYVQTCGDNKGGMNGLFFDGHVTLMSDQQSRTIEMWYPAGASVQGNPVGMTTVPSGYEIP